MKVRLFCVNAIILLSHARFPGVHVFVLSLYCEVLDPRLKVQSVVLALICDLILDLGEFDEINYWIHVDAVSPSPPYPRVPQLTFTVVIAYSIYCTVS